MASKPKKPKLLRARKISRKKILVPIVYDFDELKKRYEPKPIPDVMRDARRLEVAHLAAGVLWSIATALGWFGILYLVLWGLIG